MVLDGQAGQAVARQAGRRGGWTGEHFYLVQQQWLLSASERCMYACGQFIESFTAHPNPISAAAPCNHDYTQK